MHFAIRGDWADLPGARLSQGRPRSLFCLFLCGLPDLPGLPGFSGNAISSPQGTCYSPAAVEQTGLRICQMAMDFLKTGWLELRTSERGSGPGRLSFDW